MNRRTFSQLLTSSIIPGLPKDKLKELGSNDQRDFCKFIYKVTKQDAITAINRFGNKEDPYTIIWNAYVKNKDHIMFIISRERVIVFMEALKHVFDAGYLFELVVVRDGAYTMYVTLIMYDKILATITIQQL